MPFSPQSALDLQRSEVGNFSKFKKLTPAYWVSAKICTGTEKSTRDGRET
jgi:hypothetical protein